MIVAELRGRYGEAGRLAAEGRRNVEERGSSGAAVLGAAWWARNELQWRADTARALQIMEEALERWPLDSIPVLDRPYPELVEVYASAGDPEQARVYLSAYERANEKPDRNFQNRRHAARGRIALAEGRPADAIAEYRLVDDEMYIALALAYERAGEPDSAIAFYERFVHRYGFRVLGDAGNLGHAYEQLGQLYEARGDADRSVYYYGKLIVLWEDADAELQPRVEAARRAIGAQSPDT
jgi:tetratricopeptide (TPR) repeat protein